MQGLYPLPLSPATPELVQRAWCTCPNLRLLGDLAPLGPRVVIWTSPQVGPSPHRHSLQQVLLLCTGIVVMVLFSLFVE